MFHFFPIILLEENNINSQEPGEISVHKGHVYEPNLDTQQLISYGQGSTLEKLCQALQYGVQKGYLILALSRGIDIGLKGIWDRNMYCSQTNNYSRAAAASSSFFFFFLIYENIVLQTKDEKACRFLSAIRPSV